MTKFQENSFVIDAECKPSAVAAAAISFNVLADDSAISELLLRLFNLILFKIIIIVIFFSMSLTLFLTLL
jgi:hypothetical protein